TQCAHIGQKLTGIATMQIPDRSCQHDNVPGRKPAFQDQFSHVDGFVFLTVESVQRPQRLFLWFVRHSAFTRPGISPHSVFSMRSGFWRKPVALREAVFLELPVLATRERRNALQDSCRRTTIGGWIPQSATFDRAPHNVVAQPSTAARTWSGGLITWAW